MNNSNTSLSIHYLKQFYSKFSLHISPSFEFSPYYPLLTNPLSPPISSFLSGDTSIIGAGTYANDKTCAVSATGKGEEFMRYVAAYDVSGTYDSVMQEYSLVILFVCFTGQRLSSVCITFFLLPHCLSLKVLSYPL